MDFYGCAQPTYEDLDLTGAEWVTHSVVEPLLADEPRDDETTRPGAPAPRSLATMSSRCTPLLFPGRHRSAARKMRGKAVPYPTKRYLSPDVWRYSVLLFCDVSTLLRLNATCRQLRAVLNDPTFIVEWQTACWFLKRRGCRCERNLFYLDVTTFLSFAWDALNLTSSRQSDVALKSAGRCVNLELAPRIRLPYLDPTKQPTCFMPGLLDIWYENWLVPMPRMLSVPVEDAHVGGPWTDAFWEHHHPIPDSDDDGSESEEGSEAQHHEASHPPPAPGFVSIGPDLVAAYEADCAEHHRDPHDPAQDNAECLGYHAVRWARRRMYESAVGVQVYPLSVCLRRNQMVGRAYRNGASHLGMLFLPTERRHLGQADAEIQMLTHTGLVYFHPVRYNNEAGDFVPWALSTLALLQGLYRHAWFDSVHHILRRLDEFTRDLAREVQEDMPLHRMAERWQHLHRRVFLGEAAIPQWHVGGAWPGQPLIQEDTEPLDTARERRQQQDQAALDLLYDPHYAPYNRILGRMAEREDCFFDATVGAPYSRHYPYLTELLGDPARHFAAQRTEATLVEELRELMRLSDYVVRFAITVGPQTDRMTELRRYRCLNCYLGVGTSLLLFAPSFRRVPSWRPSEGGRTLATDVPRVNLQHNHRFRKYLRFLNRRTLFYVSEPLMPAEEWDTEVNPRS